MEVPEFEGAMSICFYSYPQPGIGGIIKYRYEDFMVEEIALGGVRLRMNADFSSILRLPRSGKYTYAIIVKSGINHYDAISLLARRLGVRASSIGVAGIKDARALTIQLISIKGLDPQTVIKRTMNLRNPRVMWAGYGYGPLKPGMLAGNAFTVIVRDVRLDAGELVERVEDFIRFTNTAKGLPNFYGHQRFGIPRYSSHLVGRCIVQGDYEGAVENLVGNPFEGEPEAEYEARQIYSETRDPERTLKHMPKNLVYERRVLRYLKKSPGDYLGAMLTLPSSLLKLYVEAFSSYLYNKFICGRAERGLPFSRPVDGDLIALVDSKGYPTFRTFRVGYEIRLEKAIELLHSGRAAHVLPVPGYMVKLSEGLQGEIEQKTLREEQVSLADFRLYELRRKIVVPGSYRRLLFKPKKLKLLGVADDEFFPGSLKVKLYFELGSGEYATVLLRELMKPRSMWAYVGGPFRG